MLKGRISGFEGYRDGAHVDSAAHVDSSWSVMLKEMALTPAANFGDDMGMAKGSGQAGDWTAQGYGPEKTEATATTDEIKHRPTGFFGNFNAHFTDGHAAGAYVTRENP